MARDPMAINGKMKKALKDVHKVPGMSDELDNRTMFALHRRGFVRRTTKGWYLTAAGKKILK